jgi:tetratricopeptide (TPR) repeat protein
VHIGTAGQVIVYQGLPLVAARSVYLELVLQMIAPPALVGREEELAELSRFCLDPDRGPYAWWRAEAWAGKSALLSTFVLRPPAEVAKRVRLVSFFITARRAGQDTREAFMQVLSEQLAELLGHPLPSALAEAMREAFLLDLLARAAVMCQDNGQRLVLVVDGLDEDRTPGPHSIAGLLPADPPAGMRVIVAGRPSPPVPGDVPCTHPLVRDPGIIRQLTSSPHAQGQRRQATGELQRLLCGSPAEQDVLGFLTAARGGLSDSDLEELTGAPLWEIQGILHAATGRSFTSRVRQPALGTGTETYLLGHEELQATAINLLGRRLAGYRDRLHAWAGTYRKKGWPPDTPEYLLGGYFGLLIGLGDLPRMIQCAGDLSRHDRMLDLTGADAAALAEIGTTLDSIADEEAPDLSSALNLAFHRDQIAGRNAHIPQELPAVWAALGRPQRALALARSIPEPFWQASALARVARALATAGARELAIAAAEEAEKVAAAAEAQSRARDWLARSDLPGVLVRVAEALVVAGARERAENMAGRLDSEGLRSWRAEALARMARAHAAAGAREQAIATAAEVERTAGTITRTWSEEALVRVAGALAMIGSYEQAEKVAQSITSVCQQAEALARIARTLATAGARERAVVIAAKAEMITAAEAAKKADGDEFSLVEPLSWIVSALAAAGAYEYAERVARLIPHPARALARIARALAATGAREQAEDITRSITHPYEQAEALTRMADGLAAAGAREQAIAAASKAEKAARSMRTGYRRADTMTKMAGALAGAGLHDQAIAAAGKAEEAIRSLTDNSQGDQRFLLQSAAGAMATAGAFERAEEVARSITDTLSREQALAQIAAAMAAAGAYQEAERIARSITSWLGRAGALSSIGEALAAAGTYEEAERIARTITTPFTPSAILAAMAKAGDFKRAEKLAQAAIEPSARAEALAAVAQGAASAGAYEQALATAREAERTAKSITPHQRETGFTLAQVAEALAAARAYEQAEEIARSITDTLTVQPLALEKVAEAMAASGACEQAERLARSIINPGETGLALARIAEELAAAGAYEQAGKIARSITESSRQADAFARMTDALLRAGDTQSASRAAAALCTIGDWATAARPVLLLEPSAFAKLGLAQEER